MPLFTEAELRAAAGPLSLICAPTMDVRASDGEDGEIIFHGHGAVFDVLSEELGYGRFSFREKVARGAFRRVLDEHQDTVFVFNHDGLPLARTSANSLELREDPRGLHYYARAVPTTVAQDLALAMRAGNVTQSSFAFTVAEDRWEETTHEDGTVEAIRTVLKVERLYDVSAVTFPAYPQADSNVRSSSGVVDLATRGRLLERIAERHGLHLPAWSDTIEELAERVASTDQNGHEEREARRLEQTARAKRLLALEQTQTLT